MSAAMEQKRKDAPQGGERGERISVSFSVSDSYAQHLAVVIASILYNNPGSSFVFHVLHRDFSEENMARVKELENFRRGAMCRTASVKFHKIDSSRFDAFPIPPGLEHVTQETYYRYLLPEVLADEDRTIYSDVDVLCVGDIRPLWETDLQGKTIAAVRNYDGEKMGHRDDIVRLGFSPESPYFFSGLLVMDLDRMRRESYASQFMSATAKYGNSVGFIDLDIINLVCEGKIKKLSNLWNETGRYSPLRRDVRIWHFPGVTQKPWCNIWKNTTWPIYLKYLLKSPYRANAARFVWGHVKGFFFFKYTKKRVTRWLVCGIRVWKRKEKA